MSNITGLKKDIVHYLHGRREGYPTPSELFSENYVLIPALVCALSSLVDDGVIEFKEHKIRLC